MRVVPRSRLASLLGPRPALVGPLPVPEAVMSERLRAIAAVLRRHGIRGPAHDHGGCVRVYARQIAQAFELEEDRGELTEGLCRALMEHGIDGAAAAIVALELGKAWDGLQPAPAPVCEACGRELVEEVRRAS